MCDAIAHRGPDDDGFGWGEGFVLGMRRLAIIDVSHGQQPVYDESHRITSVFNGEIYNFREIQGRLRASGHRLASESDSECIPHLYEQYGPDLVHQLRGMFSIAVWDSGERTLLLARDRVGKKPLYYFEDGSRLWFASELKALLVNPRVPREADPVDSTTVDRLSNDPSVMWVGWREDLQSLYPVFDVLVFPSYREGLPNVVLEAQAAGVPVVAYAATGTTDAVLDGVTGVLVDVGSVRALSGAIEVMLKDEARRKEMGRAAQRWVATEFSQDRFWDELIRYYRAWLD